MIGPREPSIELRPYETGVWERVCGPSGLMLDFRSRESVRMLSDLKAVITGASAGIGEACARKLARPPHVNAINLVLVPTAQRGGYIVDRA